MTRIYLVTALTMLAVNLGIEYATLTRRRGPLLHVLSRLAASVLTVAAMLVLRRFGLLGSYLLRAVATLPFFFSCQYLFTESFAQKTFLYFMDYSATAFVSTLCLWVAAMLPLGAYADLTASLLFVVAALAFQPFYFKRVRPRVRQLLALFREGNPLYAAYPVLSFAYFALVFGPVKVSASFGWFGLLMLYVGLTALTYVILFSHFTAAYDRLQAQGAAALADRQLRLQRKYYEEADKHLRGQDKLMHDLRHHLVGLSTLAKAGDAAAVERYLEGFRKAYDQPPSALVCENAPLNAVIGGYLRVAEAKGIAVRARLDLPAELGMDEYELCSFFGNSLENAIEACERIPAGSEIFASRFIALEAWVESGRLVVRQENSALEEPGRKDPGFPSSKGSGIGLASMRAAVEKYRGSMGCERRGPVFVLSAVFCPAS